MPAKTFGPRYGRRLKIKYNSVKVQQAAKHKCPYCNKSKVKRLAAGIWNCTKCHTKFASKAYAL